MQLKEKGKGKAKIREKGKVKCN